MELIEAIDSRKSIRGYQATPVPREVLKRILEIAARAPSNENAQPWEFHVLGGTVLGDLRNAIEQKVAVGAPSNMDFPLDTLVGVHRARQVEVGKSLLQLMGVPREDKEKRMQWLLRNFRLFDAPNAIIVTIDHLDQSYANYYFMVSVGMLAQNIALAALEFGLGTCVNIAALFFPDLVRQTLVLPESKKLAVGLAIGYPDWDYPANSLRTTREPIDDITSWHGIDAAGS